MNYVQYYPIDAVNGPGTRSVLFVAGCIHGCKGCYNQSSWNPKAGVEFTQELEDRIIEDLQSTLIPRRGLTLTGGDPLLPRNHEAIAKLIDRVREECPGKDIWLWTGYTMETLTAEQQAIANKVDVLVDGKFVKELQQYDNPWMGSSNQRMIDIRTGNVVTDTKYFYPQYE